MISYMITLQMLEIHMFVSSTAVPLPLLPLLYHYSTHSLSPPSCPQLPVVSRCLAPSLLPSLPPSLARSLTHNRRHDSYIEDMTHVGDMTLMYIHLDLYLHIYHTIYLCIYIRIYQSISIYLYQISIHTKS